jgi:hypothetical protein
MLELSFLFAKQKTGFPSSHCKSSGAGAQGRQTHCAKLTKSDSPKMTFFVSAKDSAQYLLCQPTV